MKGRSSKPGKKAANYTQVKTLYGDKFDLTPTQVHEAIPELPFKPGKGVVTVVEQPVWKLPTTMTPLSPVLFSVLSRFFHFGQR